jgi:dTDP-4-amino-4,6-dideoxygalactose transaminase
MQIPIVALKNLIPQKVIDEVGEILRSGYWADGPNVHKLEKEFANYCGTKFCRAVSNGTTALMTIMGALGLGPGDEVIIPSFSFIATANCIKSVGATPIFAEIDPKTFTLDPDSAESKITERTKAIMPVHLYGLCADMKRFSELCEQKSLFLLEDAAQAHGSAIDNKKAGSFGAVGAFSLYPTKNMFSGGEGGLITTDNEELYEKIKLYVNHGQSQKYIHTAIGYNFRMAEVIGAVSLYALEKLDIRNGKRQKNAEYLSNSLKDLESMQTPFIPEGYSHVYHQYTIKTEQREQIIAALVKEKIGYGIHYKTPIHQQPYYKDNSKEKTILEITDKTAEQVLSLPIHPEVSEEQIKFLSETIEKAVK